MLNYLAFFYAAPFHLTNIHTSFPIFCLHSFTMKPFPALTHLPFPANVPIATSPLTFTALLSPVVL